LGLFSTALVRIARDDSGSPHRSSENDVECQVAGVHGDILGAIHYLRERGERAPVAVFGHSYGAVAALQATAQSPEIAAAISDGGFASATEVLANVTRYYLHNAHTPLWAKSLLVLSKCPGVQSAAALAFYLRTGQHIGAEMTTVLPAVSRIHRPVLFISGEQDFIAPTENARRMFAALPSTQKFLLVVPGAGHNNTYKAAPSQYETAVIKFLADTIGKL
jgi:pimeloyl-ACP methyl ester carboxylesterase